MTTCPACAEKLPPNALACPRCGISVNPAGASHAAGPLSLLTLLGLMCVGVFVVVGSIYYFDSYFTTQHVRTPSNRTTCKNNLKQIGLALQNYHDVNGSFPPAYVADALGRPLYSWRVLILPYLDQAELYNAFDMSEAWDGPHNGALLAKADIGLLFRCPSDNSAGHITNYVAVLGKDCVFRGTEPVRIRDITDGTTSTLLVGETTGTNIHWASPYDVDITKYPDLGNPKGFCSMHQGGAQFLLADGSVRFISSTTPQSTLDALYSRAGGETVPDY